VRSLAAQAPAPLEVIAVVRDTDAPSHEVVAELQRAALPFALRKGVVSEAGFMPPVREGIRLAEGDVVAVMDDDAEAENGWVERILLQYADAHVGAVGGRCINMDGERVVEVEETDRVGYVSVLGRFVGNMYKRPAFSSPRDVQFLMGGCMSFRKEVAHELEFDPGLNMNVAFGYEVDLGLQVRAMGRRVVFDPAIAVRHYSAPREIPGQRAPDDRASAYWAAYNETRVALRRFSAARAAIALTWRLIIGSRRAPGIAPWLLAPFARIAGFQTAVAGAALNGIVTAFRDVVVGAHRRSG
jgi:GT2 family glycosyltransferase